MPKTRMIQRAALASALRRVPIFNGLPEEDVSRIAGYATRQTLARDEILFEEGAPSAVIRLSISKGTLASELGTRQETLSRILAKLRAAGEIEVDDRKITIRDSESLRRLFADQLSRSGTS